MGTAVFCYILYALVFVLTYLSVGKDNSTLNGANEKKYDYFFGGMLSIIFLIQLIVTCFLPGYIQDTGLFKMWASFGDKYHIWEYYTTDNYVDYPPVYLCVLFTMGKLASLFGVGTQSAAYLGFVRVVPILFDALCSLYIYKLAKEKMGVKQAFTLGFLCSVNPIIIFNSTVWGQVDSVVTLLLCIMLMCLYNKKYIGAVALFVVTFLTKPQMIIYAPLMGFFILFDFIEIIKEKEKRNKFLKDILISLGVAILLLLIIPLPVTGGNYKLVIDKYISAAGLYKYATVCAANFYGMLGANWTPNTDIMFIFSYKTWGFIFIVVMSILVGVAAFKSKDRTKVFYLAAFTVSTIYMLAHGMHERYLYALFMILMILYIMTQNSKMLVFYLLFTGTNLFNCVQVLIANHEETFVYGDNTLFILISAANVIIYGFMIYFFVKSMFFEKAPVAHGAKNTAHKTGGQSFFAKSKKSNSAVAGTLTNSGKFSFQGPEEKTRLVKLDFIIMAVIMLVYGCSAFYHLGSREVPETGWYPETANEAVTLDLGEVRNVERIYLRTGWIDRHVETRDIKRTLNVSVSNDGETFTEAGPITIEKIFTWKAIEMPLSARYIKLVPDDNRFYLNEICFFGKTEAEKYSPVNVIGSETALLLEDEQMKVRYEFSWYDNTYFDEIYHPRTAYENITHRYPYENTHPPLGKLIISLGMLLFGVNPFGWRFFGTLCGVLMVPMAYLLGKKLLKTTFFATIVTLLFTFDFMHLSQTRLATIDSYTAFFIMGMYYFMYLYVKKSFYFDNFKKMTLMLFLSGLFFSLGVSTKWQGIYAGAGLCVLFFIALYKRYKEYVQAEKIVKLGLKNAPIDIAAANNIVESFKPMAIKTVACGALFFVVMPLIIYFLSYIPAMNTEYTGLSFFFTNQTSMYNYHSSLESTHPYMSSWWQWPFDMKPLYASNPDRMFVPSDMAMGITTFGNPLVWWLTLPVIIAAIITLARKKGSTELSVMVAGFASMYLPWVLISRSSYIYHFFPCVIFVVLMAVYFVKELSQKFKHTKKIAVIYTIAVIVLFVMFYPVLTGMEVPASYVETYLKWFPGWVLG